MDEFCTLTPAEGHSLANFSMRLLYLWLANAGAVALVRFHFIPRIRRYIEHHRSPAVIKKGATLAVAGWVESILLIAFLSGGLVLLATLALRFLGGRTAEQLGRAVQSAQVLRNTIAGFGPVWGCILLFVGTLGLGIHASRRGRLRMTLAFDAVRERELERLKQEMQAGTWEEIRRLAK